MARIVELECWNCRHVWQMDLEQNQDKIVIHKAVTSETALDTYSFSCPNCGKATVTDVPRKGATHDR